MQTKRKLLLCEFLDMLVFEAHEAADRAAKEALDKKNDSWSHAFVGPKTFNCQICLSSLAKKNGMKLVWYLINFTKFYRNFQTNCGVFLVFFFCNTRKENTVLNRLHTYRSLLFDTFLCFEKGRGSCLRCKWCCYHN